jgi:ABC-type Fe3+ transport system permease subunit
MIAQSLGVAAMAGVLASAVGVATCWLARDSRWFHALALGIMATVWASSGPIIGLGLTEAIEKILPVAPHWLAWALYYGKSPVPILWTEFIRYLPAAIALLWPMVRLVPRELLDAAQVDGAGPWDEFAHILVPLMIGPCAWTALAVGVLGLGEVSAGKIVATPGWKNFSHEVFTQMHYGVSNDLAAMCLLLLGLIVVGGLLVLIFSKSVEASIPK